MTDELNALAGAYALDALNDDERAVFEQHLKTCSECAEEVLGMQNAAAELSHIEAAAAPPQVRADLLVAISKVRPLAPLPTNIVSINRARRSRWTTRAAALVSAAAAVVALGWGYQQHRDADDARTAASGLAAAIAAPDSRSVNGALGGASTGITASVYYSKASDAVVMSAHGLKNLASNKTYQAWLISPTGVATSLGTFEPDSKGSITMAAHADLADAASIGVTVEPAGGSKSPSEPAETVNL